jgi:hypothetical protein
MTSFVRPISAAAPQGVGQPVPRVEDERLVTGRGRYSDDVSPPGQAHASPRTRCCLPTARASSGPRSPR